MLRSLQVRSAERQGGPAIRRLTVRTGGCSSVIPSLIVVAIGASGFLVMALLADQLLRSRDQVGQSERAGVVRGEQA